LRGENKVLYIKIPCISVEEGKSAMFEKMEIREQADMDDQREIRQKIEVTLHRLQELRGRIEELKRKCEEIRKAQGTMHSQRMTSMMPRRSNVPTYVENSLRCDKCGHTLDPERQVVIKDSNGAERSRYHEKCFQALFK
jgi:DNA repair exonuclease SbcCD ATPase subunit